MKKALFIIAFFLLLTAGNNQLLLSQELPDTVWTKTFSGPGSPEINCVKFSPDGQYIFAGTNDVILQIETATGNIFRTLPGHTANTKVLNIDFSPTGDTIISSGDDRVIRLWKYQTGDSIYSLKYERPDSLNIRLAANARITPDGNRIITLTQSYGSNNYEAVYIFDIHTKELITSKVKSSQVYQLAVSSDAKYFAVAVYPNSILLYDLNTYQLIKVLGSHDENVRDLAFSPDSKMLASSGDDGKVFVWDVETRQLIHTFSVYNELTSVTSIVFSNDIKNIIASGGSYGDKHIKVYSLESEILLYTYPHPFGGSNLDINYNNNYLINSSSRNLYLLNPKWKITGIDEPIEPATIIYPNPVDMNVNIEFTVNNPEIYNIDLLDLSGNHIGNIFTGFMDAGPQSILYNCSTLASGSYIIRITSPTFSKTYKLVKEG